VYIAPASAQRSLAASARCAHSSPPPLPPRSTRHAPTAPRTQGQNSRGTARSPGRRAGAAAAAAPPAAAAPSPAPSRLPAALADVFSRGDVAAVGVFQGQLSQTAGYAPRSFFSGQYWTLVWPATDPFIGLAFVANPGGVDEETGEEYPPFLTVGFETPVLPREAQEILFGRVVAMDPARTQLNIELPLDELDPGLEGQLIWPRNDPAHPRALVVPGVVGVRFPLKTRATQGPTIPTPIF